MEIIPLAGYTEEEKLHIARRYLVPRQLDEHGLDADQVDDRGRRRCGGSSREYTREAGVRSLERQIGAVARKIAARVAARPTDGAAAPDRRCTAERRARLPRAAAVPRRGRVPRVAARRRDRRGVDRDRRRRAVHRSEPAAGRPPQPDPDRPARQRDAGVGARRRQPHPRVSATTLGVAAGVSRQARPARPRAGRRDPQGRPVGRRDDGDGDRVGAAGISRCAKTWR